MFDTRLQNGASLATFLRFIFLVVLGSLAVMIYTISASSDAVDPDIGVAFFTPSKSSSAAAEISLKPNLQNRRFPYARDRVRSLIELIVPDDVSDIYLSGIDKEPDDSLENDATCWKVFRSVGGVNQQISLPPGSVTRSGFKNPASPSKDAFVEIDPYPARHWTWYGTFSPRQDPNGLIIDCSSEIEPTRRDIQTRSIEISSPLLALSTGLAQLPITVSYHLLEQVRNFSFTFADKAQITTTRTEVLEPNGVGRAEWDDDAGSQQRDLLITFIAVAAGLAGSLFIEILKMAVQESDQAAVTDVGS